MRDLRGRGGGRVSVGMAVILVAVWSPDPRGLTPVSHLPRELLTLVMLE